MSKIMQFNNFKTSYNELKNNSRKRYLVEFYHHAFPGEPVISVLDNIYEISSDEIESESFISIKTFMGNTDITFRSNEYETNLSNGHVVFASKYDNDTYCLISFHEEVI